MKSENISNQTPVERLTRRSFGDMLFEREKEPDEINNLIDNPEYAEVENQL